MPAPAGSNVGREGSITASIAELVTFESGHFSTKTPISGLLCSPLGGCLQSRLEAASALPVQPVYLCPLVPDFHVETIGSGPRVVLVHGSVGNGSATWDSLRPLADRYTLVIPIVRAIRRTHRSTRLTSSREAEAIAELLQPGDHLVGALLRRRDLAARGGAGGRSALADSERAAGVRRRARESRRRGVPGEDA